MLDFERYEVVSFDCYGTLIDWEGGIVSGMRPVLDAHGIGAADEEILDLHARTEHRLQAASRPGAYVKYRDVLGEEVREAVGLGGIDPPVSLPPNHHCGDLLRAEYGLERHKDKWVSPALGALLETSRWVLGNAESAKPVLR